MDHEDLMEKILDGLGDDYKPIVDATEGREIPITFDELDEKLINKELSLRLHQSSTPHMPDSANVAHRNHYGLMPIHRCLLWMPTVL